MLTSHRVTNSLSNEAPADACYAVRTVLNWLNEASPLGELISSRSCTVTTRGSGGAAFQCIILSPAEKITGQGGRSQTQLKGKESDYRNIAGYNVLLRTATTRARLHRRPSKGVVKPFYVKQMRFIEKKRREFVKLNNHCVGIIKPLNSKCFLQKSSILTPTCWAGLSWSWWWRPPAVTTPPGRPSSPPPPPVSGSSRPTSHPLFWSLRYRYPPTPRILATAVARIWNRDNLSDRKYIFVKDIRKAAGWPINAMSEEKEF